ncbi:MAG TPA: glycosyltransferase family 4 protein [Solirubrobacteraceae bacterium]|jgi:glycosyltransferase involved in cell wall biosynthesis|nr:glycosyltransferase family 4 protein [Solirubrobacteraceae bacterium]
MIASLISSWRVTEAPGSQHSADQAQDSTQPEGRLHIASVQTSGERGGAEYANVELLNAFRGRGLDARLVSDQPGLVIGTDVPVTEIDLGPKIKRSTWRRLAINCPLLVWRLARALAREGRDDPIDVLLLHFKKEQLISALLPRRLTGVVVWAEWGPLPTPLTRGPARWLYVTAARRARMIAAVSESTRESLISAGVPAAKVVVIHNIVDAEEVTFDEQARDRYRREWGFRDDTFVIGCVSRLNSSKRNDVIVDSMSYLAEDVVLVFAGEGDDEEALRAQAAAHGDRVRFLPTPRGYVQDVLSACDLVAFAPQPIEGAPRSIIFGQLTERPVVATGPEGARDMIPPDTGTILASPHDPKALAACIEAYKEDPERRAQEGHAGRVLAQARYDRRAVVDEWVRHIRAVVRTSAPA